jgi:hypothetical protein
LGPSIKPSTDTCKDAIIFLIVILPYPLVLETLYPNTGLFTDLQYRIMILLGHFINNDRNQTCVCRIRFAHK